MNVSKRSWHFKLYTFWRQSWDWNSGSPWEFFLLLTRRSSLSLGSYKPKNLCQYFWTIVGLSIVSLFILVGLNIVIGAAVLILWPSFWLSDKIGANRARRRVAKGLAPSKGPGLVRSVMSAKKKKVCPLIQVVD